MTTNTEKQVNELLESLTRRTIITRNLDPNAALLNSVLTLLKKVLHTGHVELYGEEIHTILQHYNRIFTE